MTLEQLVPGRLYVTRDGVTVQLSRCLSDPRRAIFHPPGEPDMQSSFAVLEGDLDRLLAPGQE